MSNRLQDKVAVITGGTTGIGLATARRFVAEGAHVFITGRRQAELDVALKELGPRVTGVQGDVSRPADLDRLYERVRREHDHIDILFANAGGGEFAPLGAISEEHFARTFDINVKGTVFTVQKALLLLRDGGSIIVTGSTAATKGSPAFSVYGATKAALRSFTRNWMLDLKDRRIRVNTLSPGPIRTPGLHGLGKTEDESRAILDSLAASVPMGRLGDPDEVARAAVFLASDDSSFVNGTELFVDGGLAQI
ncbi:SDR family NAD(P)-dependent oxidoreductase [Archangium lansingense]|uniref:SDR family NAD(P)-dependent oxidoreductase n=1 Tax=Archangium lansingense TaxID=2995310 RepID=UPI003B7689FD